ncbi:MAG: DASH family cryptochrome, partial [bacterium]
MPGRGVLRLSGGDVRTFLQALVTRDLDDLSPDRAVYGALLTPQGKYLFDFFLAQQGDDLLLDGEAGRLDDLAKRLKMYKLRADVTFQTADGWQVYGVFGGVLDGNLGLGAGPGAARPFSDGVAYMDPRLPEAGARIMAPAGQAEEILTASGFMAGDPTDYNYIRLGLALPDSGSDLVVDVGPPEECIPKLVPPGASCTVFAQREVTPEEIAAERAVAKALPGRSRLDLVWGSTLYHLDDLEFDVLKKMPTVFTPFRQKVENGSTVRPTLPALKVGDLGSFPAGVDVDAGRGRHIERVEDLPASLVASPMSSPAKDPRSAFTMAGGETVALERLKYYLFDSKIVSNYFNIRNGMLGGDYSTKLAPALAHGCISPRMIHSEISRYEREHSANKSTYWVIFELIWRDYFKFYALAQGAAIFLEGGPVGRRKVWEQDPGGEKFRRWKEGRTGWPLVDANMRELAATGFMSNRGRQNVASFLCLDLNLDWRLGADYFEHQLLDYDVASNWGNW